jgi:oxalate decarboxylase
VAALFADATFLAGMREFTRRNFIGAAAALAGGLTALQKLNAGELTASNRSKSDPGPANPALDEQNRDSIWPPTTDSKSLVQNFKYPFSFANKRTYEGGWSREVTVRELPDGWRKHETHSGWLS